LHCDERLYPIVDEGHRLCAMDASGAGWYEHLSPDRCWELLGSSCVGRVGVLVDSAPEIYPVNFAVDGATIVFRTDPGNKLRGVDRSPSICFQIDGFDAGTRTGWSVLVKGRAVLVREPDEVARLEQVALEPWAFGDKDSWIQIIPVEVTGRRLHRGAVASERR
jgi:nitroimidazol reductase NimA-like FMN-containing flavoprotein (pyridoxamine 5'-phosphate oxidase superfamily)